MRRILLLLAILAAAAGLGMANASAAQANTCSVSGVGPVELVSTYTIEMWESSASCTGRWYANVSYQYESGGLWHTPNTGSADFLPLYDPQSAFNCPDTTTDIGERNCFGTSDGLGGGYWGAGNTGYFNLPNLNSHANDMCSVNWRVVSKLYDYNSNTLIRTNSDELLASC